MNKKKIAEFLLLKPAFTTRNLTSLMLVALFFGVYVAAGGKVRSFPAVKPSKATFGDIELGSNEVPSKDFIRNADAPVKTAPRSEEPARARLFSKPDKQDIAKDSSETEKSVEHGSLDSINRLQSLNERLNKRE